MFFGTVNPNLRSVLKPEVEIMVFLRMRSNKITKNAGKCPSNTVLRPNVPRVYVFRHGESNFEVQFETGSKINGVSRMRSNRNVKNAEKRPQNTVLRPNFPRVYVFRHGESEYEVHFETGRRINGVSAHAQ